MERKIKLEDLMETDSGSESLKSVKSFEGMETSTDESSSGESSVPAGIPSFASIVAEGGVPGVVWIHRMGNLVHAVDI